MGAVDIRANCQVNATPQFRVLSDGQIEEVFHAALDVLQRVGTRLHGEEALALLGQAGCQVEDGNLVPIPAWLVKQALSTTPGRIVVAGRNPSCRIVLEESNLYFGTGSDCPSVVDSDSGKVRRYTLSTARCRAVGRW